MNSLAHRLICRNILVATINDALKKGLIQFIRASDPDWPDLLALDALEDPVLGPLVRFEFRHAGTDLYATLYASADGIELVVVATDPEMGECSAAAVGLVIPTGDDMEDNPRRLILRCEALHREDAVVRLLAMKDVEPYGYSLVQQ